MVHTQSRRNVGRLLIRIATALCPESTPPPAAVERDPRPFHPGRSSRGAPHRADQGPATPLPDLLQRSPHQHRTLPR
jgi:hypothetical protein